MNLKKRIKNEIELLDPNINKLSKAYYVYIRLCELFTFDVNYIYNNQTVSQLIQTNKNIDINNITNNSIICHGWAKMYHDILKELKINSKIIEGKHALVEVFIDNYIISAAPCYIKNHDFTKVKIGLPTENFTAKQGITKNQLNILLKPIIELINIPQEDIEKKKLVEIIKKINISTDKFDLNMLEKMKTICLIINENNKLRKNNQLDTLDFQNRIPYFGFHDGEEKINYLIDNIMSAYEKNKIISANWCEIINENSVVSKIFDIKLSSGRVSYGYIPDYNREYSLQQLTSLQRVSYNRNERMKKY